MPSADSRYVISSPCGPLTRSLICCCMPIFVFPAPCGIGLDGGQDAMTHRRRDFVLPVLPDSPVIFSAAPTSETQRASRGKHRLLSAHDRQIYVVWPYDGYRALSCVADSPRPYPASNLPALYPFGYGAMRALASRSFWRGTSTHAFASGFLQAHIAVTPLPSAILPLRQGGSGLCLICVS